MKKSISEMPTADLFQLMHECAKEIENRRMEANDKVQYFDKISSKYNHEIETELYSASSGYKTVVDYQWQLRCRRIAKYDQAIFTNVRDVGDGNFKEWKEFIYLLKRFMNINPLSVKSREDNENYLNGKQKPRITYADMVKEYDKRYGSLDDALSKLQKRIDISNKNKKKGA